ncbi:MAG TPA: hypothetical protein VN745_09825 [Verrucomicrobiae bacterium]|nr:hypothetical protein [Verrucomicrobiae bacterium]
MRGKQLNSGIRGGLWDDAHLDRMGPAVWLFGWLVHRQTRERFGVGLVLGGAPLTYEMIREDTGMPARTLKRWMSRLVRAGYVRITHRTHKRMVIEIVKAKKFGPQQLGFPQQRPTFPQVSQRAPFFAPNSKGPLLALNPTSKGPIVALKNRVAPAQAVVKPSTCARPVPAHREFTSERKETEAPLAQNCAARSHLQASNSSYEENANSKRLREQRLRSELRVGAGPEIHRE